VSPRKKGIVAGKTEAAPAPPDTRCGFVAIIGAPNAGKSTLVNALVGAKVTIVTHKVQTTRSLIRGIVVAGASQIVLVDTPGIFAPRRRLDRAMVQAAWSGAQDADLVVFIVDAQKGLEENVAAILARLADVRQPRILALNKVDRVKKERLLALAAEINTKLAFERTFMISALTGDGIDELEAYLAGAMQPGPWLYPEDDITDAPLRSLAAEITREKLYVRLHEELPYHSTVETTQWKDMKAKGVRVEQTIFVERESQRQIVLGKGGRTIKAISMESRHELAQIIERPIHLFLFVKVRESWSDDPERYREMGLEFPTD
jgi:GTP-binding protein Era